MRCDASMAKGISNDTLLSCAVLKNAQGHRSVDFVDFFALKPFSAETITFLIYFVAL